MRPRQFTDAEMIAHARTCFLAHGPNVATAEIAKGLGVSPAALFRRAGSKRELLLRALAPPEVPPFVAMLAKGPDDRPVGEQLVAIASEIDAFFAAMLPVFAVMRTAGIDPHEMFAAFDEAPPVKAIRALAGWFSELVAQGRVELEDPKSAAMAFIGGLHGPHFLRAVCGAEIPAASESASRRFAEIFYRGIAHSP